MRQTLHDLTGKPIETPRISATEREAQRLEMVAMINAMILQMNALTAKVREYEVALTAHERRIVELEREGSA